MNEVNYYVASSRSVAKGGPGPPTFLRLCPYFAFDTRLAESAVARLAISTRMAII